MAAHAGQHAVLAASALALALLAGVPLGIAAATMAPLRSPALALAGIGRTLPSLAVLTLLLPFWASAPRRPIVALALLAIPPIVIGVDLGIRGVPAAVLDAAAGMGMRPAADLRARDRSARAAGVVRGPAHGRDRDDRQRNAGDVHRRRRSGRRDRSRACRPTT